MKNFTILVFFALMLGSCSTDDLEVPSILTEEIINDQPMVEDIAVSKPVTVETSAALRTSLEQVRNLELQLNATARENQQTSLCFQFVYPITVAYNDTSLKEIVSYDELLQALLDETTNLHLTGVGFPFEVVTAADSTKIIKNEEGFRELITACGYDEIDYTYVINAVSPCFRVNYPLDFNIRGSIKTFYSQEEVYEYFNTYWSSSSTVDISYPFRITLKESGERLSIENDFEMIHLIKDVCNIQ